jgi:hypothetical protein
MQNILTREDYEAMYAATTLTPEQHKTLKKRLKFLDNKVHKLNKVGDPDGELPGILDERGRIREIRKKHPHRKEGRKQRIRQIQPEYVETLMAKDTLTEAEVKTLRTFAQRLNMQIFDLRRAGASQERIDAKIAEKDRIRAKLIQYKPVRGPQKYKKKKPNDGISWHVDFAIIDAMYTKADEWANLPHKHKFTADELDKLARMRDVLTQHAVWANDFNDPDEFDRAKRTLADLPWIGKGKVVAEQTKKIESQQEALRVMDKLLRETYAEVEELKRELAEARGIRA